VTRVACCELAPVVGDLDGNLALAQDAVRAAFQAVGREGVRSVPGIEARNVDAPDPFYVLYLDDAPEISSGPVFGGIDQQVALDQIKMGLARLTAEQLQVIVLRFLEGQSLAETAAIVGRNEDAVKKLQARGLASLRRRIECLSGCWRVDLEHAS